MSTHYVEMNQEETRKHNIAIVKPTFSRRKLYSFVVSAASYLLLTFIIAYIVFRILNLHLRSPETILH